MTLPLPAYARPRHELYSPCTKGVTSWNAPRGGTPIAPILIVEDERALAEGLRFNLQHDGYAVELAGDAERAEELLAAGSYALLLLDVMLPGASGFELLRRLRAQGVTLPVILLTARDEDVDVIRGLELGADDYVTKPFSLGQLLARIRAVLRRTAPESGSARVGLAPEVAVDLAACLVHRQGEELPLTRTEVACLELLLETPGKVVARATILDRIWGRGRYPSTRTVDNHIARLRKKLEPEPGAPRILLTVHGIGYKLCPSG